MCHGTRSPACTRVLVLLAVGLSTYTGDALDGGPPEPRLSPSVAAKAVL